MADARFDDTRPQEAFVTETVLVTVTSSQPEVPLLGEVRVYNGKELITAAELSGNQAKLQLPNARLWTPDDPFLYTIMVRAGQDQVASYVGMREFGCAMTADGRPYPTLNGQPIFHNGLLDQGYWSDGLYTPPSDEAMSWELEAIKDLGFNMVRKHIKIEPLRWYYHCDRLGLLVWQDFVSGGGPYKPSVVQVGGFLGRRYEDGPAKYKMFGRESPEGRQVFRRDMKRTVELLRNVVSLAVWVPFNEGWGQFNAHAIANEVKAMDDSRLVDHASGYFDQCAGDFHSHHIYYRRFNPKPDPIQFRHDRYGRLKSPRILALTEFGGYSLGTPGHMAAPKEFGYKVFRQSAALDAALAELYERDVLAWIPHGLAATVYTQVSDVEDEINGLFTYDRHELKPDQDLLRQLNQRIYEAFHQAVTATLG